MVKKSTKQRGSGTILPPWEAAPVQEVLRQGGVTKEFIMPRGSLSTRPEDIVQTFYDTFDLLHYHVLEHFPGFIAQGVGIFRVHLEDFNLDKVVTQHRIEVFYERKLREAFGITERKEAYRLIGPLTDPNVEADRGYDAIWPAYRRLGHRVEAILTPEKKETYLRLRLGEWIVDEFLCELFPEGPCEGAGCRTKNWPVVLRSRPGPRRLCDTLCPECQIRHRREKESSKKRRLRHRDAKSLSWCPPQHSR